MKKLSLFLMCGSGASTGFMAASIRKAAKKQGLTVKVTARGEAELESYIDDIDVVLLGPHLKYLEETMRERLSSLGKTTILMKQDYYATLDGAKALEHVLSILPPDLISE